MRVLTAIFIISHVTNHSFLLSQQRILTLVPYKMQYVFRVYISRYDRVNRLDRSCENKFFLEFMIIILSENYHLPLPVRWFIALMYTTLWTAHTCSL